MKKILLTCVLLSGLAFASENVEQPKEEKTFEQIKAKILEKNAENRECIQKATNKEELKSCKPKHKDRGEKGERENREKHSDSERN